MNPVNDGVGIQSRNTLNEAAFPFITKSENMFSNFLQTILPQYTNHHNWKMKILAELQFLMYIRLLG